MEISRLEAALRQRISGDRLSHVYGVVETALRLASRHGIDPEQARVAALMHDYAKALPTAELLALGRRFGLVTDPAEETNPDLLHAPVGAAQLQAEGLITDPEVLAAIRWHTTGTPGMSRLARLIWIADMVEPNRRFPGLERIRRLVEQDLDRGLMAGLDHSLAYLVASGRLIHLETVRTRNWLLQVLADQGDPWPGYTIGSD